MQLNIDMNLRGVDVLQQCLCSFQLDGKNDFIAKLMFLQLNDNNFQLYKLTISNDLGSNSTVIKLSKSSASTYDDQTQCSIVVLMIFGFDFDIQVMRNIKRNDCQGIQIVVELKHHRYS